MTHTLFLILAAGVPYYLLLERKTALSSKHIFLISGALLLCAAGLSFAIPTAYAAPLVLVSLLSALYTIYKAAQTTNFYKLGYYLIFINAPFFMLFESNGALYSISLLASLGGLFLIARFYEKNYGSANYQYITGISLVTPYIGTYLTLYLITLALYPPFPNALFFLNHLFNSDPNLLWYAVVITLFFGNFLLAMRVMTTTVFGRPNANIHYVHMTVNEKVAHFLVVMVLLILSLFGLKELLL